MTNTSTRDQIPAFRGIVRLIAAEHRHKTPPISGGVQKLAEFITELWMHIEYVAELRLARRYEAEIGRYVDDLQNIYDGYGRSLTVFANAANDWGNGTSFAESWLKAFFPTMLRGGSYYSPCEMADEKTSMLVRSLGWRFLAGLLTMNKLAAHKAERLESRLSETQHSLVGAAKAQRRLMEHVLRPREDVAGEMTALAVAPRDDEYFDSYLVSVNEFSAGSVGMKTVVARAKQALETTRHISIKHHILITDDISRDFALDGTYFQYDRQIHLVGNPDNVKFCIFVSNVPDHNRPLDPVDLSEGRFRLSRSRLRDAFLGVARDEANIHETALPISTGNRRLMLAPNLFQFPDCSGATAQDLSGEEKSDGLISRERVARVFFGYKGISDADPT